MSSLVNPSTNHASGSVPWVTDACRTTNLLSPAAT
jgi:hypothetical protein